MDADPGAKTGKHPVQRPSEIAEADDADLGAGEEPRRSVDFAAPELASLAEGEIGIDDAPGEIERHGEPQFRHRLGEHLPARHHVNAALEKHLIGHVVEEVAFDIEDGAQLRHAFERPLVQRRLADDVANLAKRCVIEPGNVFRIGLDDAIASIEFTSRLPAEDQLKRARRRRADDKRSLRLGHCLSSLSSRESRRIQ